MRWVNFQKCPSARNCMKFSDLHRSKLSQPSTLGGEGVSFPTCFLLGIELNVQIGTDVIFVNPPPLWGWNKMLFSADVDISFNSLQNIFSWIYPYPHPTVMEGWERWLSVQIWKIHSIPRKAHFLGSGPPYLHPHRYEGWQTWVFSADLNISFISKEKKLFWKFTSPYKMEVGKYDISVQICTFHKNPSKNILGNLTPYPNFHPMWVDVRKHNFTVKIQTFHLIFSKKPFLENISPPCHGAWCLQTWLFCPDLYISIKS